jgi:hypothetical protein
MLTEAEHYALELTNSKADFMLYGQEVNPETYAICTSDMLIKGEKSENIAYGSTLSKMVFRICILTLCFPIHLMAKLGKLMKMPLLMTEEKRKRKYQRPTFSNWFAFHF